jgi:protein-S-isoprenylcysteine O-methyltransferase Ste14
MTSPAKPSAVIKFGPIELTGVPALIVVVLLLALIVTLIVLARPSPGMLISGIIWVAFIVYWGATAKNSARTEESESNASRRLHVYVLNLSIVLLFAPIPFLTARFLPVAPGWTPLGLVVQASALSLAVFARRHLGKNWSGEVRIAVDHQLVRSGPYRWIRHPIYTAMLGMSLGTTMVSGSFHALLGFVLMFAAYVRKIQLEEKTLAEHFGDAYDRYCRESWALIPWIF